MEQYLRSVHGVRVCQSQNTHPTSRYTDKRLLCAIELNRTYNKVYFECVLRPPAKCCALHTVPSNTKLPSAREAVDFTAKRRRSGERIPNGNGINVLILNGQKWWACNRISHRLNDALVVFVHLFVEVFGFGMNAQPSRKKAQQTQETDADCAAAERMDRKHSANMQNAIDLNKQAKHTDHCAAATEREQTPREIDTIRCGRLAVHRETGGGFICGDTHTPVRAMNFSPISDETTMACVGTHEHRVE